MKENKSRPAEKATGFAGLVLAVLTGTLGWDPAVAALAIAVVGFLPAAITFLVEHGWFPKSGPFGAGELVSPTFDATRYKPEGGYSLIEIAIAIILFLIALYILFLILPPLR